MSPDAIESLRELADLARLTNVVPGSRFTLRAPELSDEERDRWEREFSMLLSACGCGTGRAAFATAVAAYLLYLAVGSGDMPRGWTTWTWGVALAVAAAILGKAVGIVFARRRLRNLIHHLKARLIAAQIVS